MGLALAYELSCLGATVTVIDAGHPGRATDAGAGILSPVTSTETDAALWPFLRQAGAHYPALLARLTGDGADVSAAGYGACGILSIGLRPHEDGWFSPFADLVLRRSPGEVAEIPADEATALFPPLGPVHRALHAPGSARVDGRGMAAALRRAAEARGIAFVEGMAHGLVSGASHGQQVESILVERQGSVDCTALAVAGGAWTGAVGEWLGRDLPVGPTKGQIVHLGVEGETGRWPIVQPLLTHYLVPWPGGRVACGGTFETGAGFSVTVTAAGLHELLRECLLVAPGARRGGLSRNPGRAAPHLGGRPRPGRAPPGLGQRLGGHGARRQRPAAGPVLGPGARPRHRRGRPAAGGGAAPRRLRSCPFRLSPAPGSPSHRGGGADVRLGAC